MDTPISDPQRPIRSAKDPGLMADHIRSGIDTARENAMLTSESYRVGQKPSSTASKTGRPGKYEYPRSPWSAYPSPMAYCTRNGWSSPIFTLNSSTDAWFTPPPGLVSNISAGSPGARCIREKLPSETMSIAGTRTRTRLRINIFKADHYLLPATMKTGIP